MSLEPPDYEFVVRPSRGWFDFDLREVWRYRDLLYLLVHRDFVSKYKQTILGPTWFVLQPLLTTAMFTVIFSHIANVPTDGLPPVLFYLAGLLPWSYFAQTFQSTSATFVANAGLFGKVYFPRLVVPLSAVVSNLLPLGLQLATFAAFWLYFRFLLPQGVAIELRLGVLLLPLLVLHIAALSLGVGLWLTALTAKYRDFGFLTHFLVQIWMYATPVIYPLSQVPPRWHWLAVMNPMTMPVELARFMLLGRGLVTVEYMAISIVMSVLLLISGIVVFSKVEKTFVDVV